MFKSRIRTVLGVALVLSTITILQGCIALPGHRVEHITLQPTDSPGWRVSPQAAQANCEQVEATVKSVPLVSTAVAKALITKNGDIPYWRVNKPYRHKRHLEFIVTYKGMAPHEALIPRCQSSDIRAWDEKGDPIVIGVYDEGPYRSVGKDGSHLCFYSTQRPGAEISRVSLKLTSDKAICELPLLHLEAKSEYESVWLSMGEF